MRRGISKLIVILLLLIVATVLIPLTIILMNRPNIRPVALPTSNGYDTLVGAGAMVTDAAELFDLEDIDKLKRFVSNNSAAQELIDEAMVQESVVPIDYDAGFVAAGDGVQSTRQALRLQQSKARIAELEGDHASAAIDLAKLFVLANKIDKEGVLIHFQVATAYRRAALTGLKSVAGSLNAEQKNEVVSIISGNGHTPLDVDAILLREDNLAKKQHGTLMVLLTKWSTTKQRQASVEQARAADSEVRHLMNEVAGLLDP